MNFNQSKGEYEQLLAACINGDIWVDAGCGTGTYTFPLSKIVSYVIAFDNNKRNIERLNQKIKSENKIETYIHDFNDPNWPASEVDGVLFAFSLHYHPEPERAVQNAFNTVKQGGEIVIIDYTSGFVVPWVPNPIPIKKIQLIIESFNGLRIERIEKKESTRSYSGWNNSSYLLKSVKD